MALALDTVIGSSRGGWERFGVSAGDNHMDARAMVGSPGDAALATQATHSFGEILNTAVLGPADQAVDA